MNHTQNYQLSQWAKSDKVQMEDFNADNAKIDAAIKAEVDARTALAAQVALRGNCQIWTTTYTGTGTFGQDHPNSLTFPKLPLFALIIGYSGTMMSLIPGGSFTVCQSMGDGGGNTVGWSGNTVSWYASNYESTIVQMNARGSKYLVIAFYMADQA